MLRRMADNSGENARNLLIYNKLRNVNEKSNKIVAFETVLQAANLAFVLTIFISLHPLRFARCGQLAHACD